jgi:hypothetical protein
MKVRVVLPMYVGGEFRGVGEIVDLPTVDALGAIYRGRAEHLKEAKPSLAPTPDPIPTPAPAPMTTESAPGLVVGKKRKSARKE